MRLSWIDIDTKTAATPLKDGLTRTYDWFRKNSNDKTQLA